MEDNCTAEGKGLTGSLCDGSGGKRGPLTMKKAPFMGAEQLSAVGVIPDASLVCLF